MRLGQVLAVRALALVQVGNGVQAQAVHAQVQPVVDDPEDGLANSGVGEVEIRLVAVEAVPVVGAGDRIPGPVGRLEIAEDDPCIAIPVRRVAPDVEVPGGAPGRGTACPLEPGMLVGGVVADELDDDPQAVSVGFVDERPHVRGGAVVGIGVDVVDDVVPVVAAGRGVEGQDPDRRDAEVAQISQLLGQPAEIAGAVAVAVEERPDRHFVDHRVLVPERVRGQRLPGLLRTRGPAQALGRSRHR